MDEDDIHPALVAYLRPLSPYLNARGQKVIDVMINGPGEVWLQIAGEPGYRREPNREITAAWADALCSTLANLQRRGYSRLMPMLLATLPGGHRFTALLGPNVVSGMMISIRVRRDFHVPLEQFGHWREHPIAPASPRQATDERPQSEILRRAVLRKGNILVSGGTCTGKTTFLNAVLCWIPPENRVITVEDVEELRLPQTPNKAQVLVSRTDTQTRVDYRAVIDSILRFNPDRILVGELSVHNALPAARLLNTGHGGFMATVHANSPLDALDAWRRNYELSPDSGGRGGDTVVRFLARNLDAIVQISLAPDGSRVLTMVHRGADGELAVPWRDLL